ncbi:Elongation of fatty acids protein 2 [Mortierella antarctica]|nr:Elongation of fatty acids protein 2 [Mortierella antarctica]
MGVKGLTGLLLRLAPAAVQRHHISHYRGKTLAVDVSCFLNRFIYGLDPHPARVQRGLYKLCLFFQQHGIRPILVFDGEDRIIEKHQEGLRRDAQKEKVNRSFQLEKDRKSRLKNLKQSTQILQDHSQETLFQDIRLFPTRVSELELVESEMDKDYNKEKGKDEGSVKDNQSQDNQSQDTDVASQIAVYVGEKDDDENDTTITNQDDDTITEAPRIHPSLFSNQDQLHHVFSMSKEFYGHEPHPLGEEHPLELGHYPKSQEFEFFKDLEMKVYLEQLIEGPPRNDIQTARSMTIQRCVHQALQNFVETIETSGQTPDQLHEISNQRQRLLNTLEWELVQEIKDMLSAAEGTLTEIATQKEAEGPWTENKVPNEQVPEEKVPKVRMPEEHVPEEQVPEDQEQTLQDMIQNVLATHQSIFATLERRTLRVTRDLVLSCQELARAMRQPVLEASDAEAESVCAQLVTLGMADATVSEDTDTAVFGNGLLLRQVGVSNKEILEINPVVARESLGLNRDAFRDLCILCGTDFSGTIEGIGPIRAARLIQYYGSIESVMANTDYTPRPTFLYDNARRVFDRTPHVPFDLLEAHRKKEQEGQEQGQEQEHQLAQLLTKYGINPEEVRKELAEDAAEKLVPVFF